MAEPRRRRGSATKIRKLECFPLSQDLKRNALAYRAEVEPLPELYRRRPPDEEATWFKLPKNAEEAQQQFELFKQMIDEQEARS